MSWDVPKCATGCSDSWIGDGYCDKACNVSSCNFDFPDCVNSTAGHSPSYGGGGGEIGGSQRGGNAWAAAFCTPGCPDAWLADRVCDAKCKVEECGWDVGDCGLDVLVDNFPTAKLDQTTVRLVVNDKAVERSDRVALSGTVHGSEYDLIKEDYLRNKDEFDGSWPSSMTDDYVREIRRYPYYGLDGAEDYFNQDSRDQHLDAIGSGLPLDTSEPTSFSTVAASASLSRNGSDNSSANHSQENPASPLSTKSFSPVALRVPIGTKAVYFNLSYFWCKLCSNSTCLEEEDGEAGSAGASPVVKYTSCRFTAAEFEESFAEGRETETRLVHSATLLTKHNALVVVLFSSQLDRPETVPNFPHNVSFTVSGTRIADLTSNASEEAKGDVLSIGFNLQITAESPPLVVSASSLVPQWRCSTPLSRIAPHVNWTITASQWYRSPFSRFPSHCCRKEERATDPRLWHWRRPRCMASRSRWFSIPLASEEATTLR
jgi:hypothetical protein